MIGINNLTITSVNEEFLQKIARKVLKGEGIKSKIELSIALVGLGRMREINKRYLGKNRITDVLSFSTFSEGGPSDSAFVATSAKGAALREGGPGAPLRKVQNLGEIIICPQQVKKNAKRFSSTFNKELAKILIHGILHLLGYDHEKSIAEAKKMEKKEQSYLSQIM